MQCQMLRETRPARRSAGADIERVGFGYGSAGARRSSDDGGVGVVGCCRGHWACSVRDPGTSREGSVGSDSRRGYDCWCFRRAVGHARPDRGGLLLSQLIVAGVTVGLWAGVRRGARPSLRWPSRGELVKAVRAHPVTAGLGAVVLATLGLEFFFALAVAPNNIDSMGYHLSRAAYWLQYKSVFQFPGGTIRQLDYPPNGEILQAWTLAVSGTDRFAQLIQWASGIGCGLCIYLGAQLLGFRRAHAVFAAGLFMVLPIVVLESTSTQNDLITAFFLASIAVFAVRGFAAPLIRGLGRRCSGTWPSCRDQRHSSDRFAFPGDPGLCGGLAVRPPRTLALVGGSSLGCGRRAGIVQLCAELGEKLAPRSEMPRI